MRLSQFILSHIAELLDEWQRFARSLPASEGMDSSALRDDAPELLERIARSMAGDEPAPSDLHATQSDAAVGNDGLETPAKLHALQRLVEGFDLNQMVAEYCALRASVLRYWHADLPADPGEVLADVLEFDRALDQSLRDSIEQYAAQLNRRRELFMGVLGHDLRSPLQVITESASRMARGHQSSYENARFASHINKSAACIASMVSDLLDVARTRLGTTLPTNPTGMDLAHLCRDVVERVSALDGERRIKLMVYGDVQGRWDAGRLDQLLTNLLRNALHHGDRDRPVTLLLRGEPKEVVIQVHNDGPPIPRSELNSIFQPMKSGSNRITGSAHPDRLGLGLYIVATIVKAHRGLVEVESSLRGGTVFSVRLPRD
jgi:signal transduction histidine kinase